MKRILMLMTVLCCIVLIHTALADGTNMPSPLLRLYQAEQNLIFNTGCVTMTGHAIFEVNDRVFKTAELVHIQEGSDSMRDWRLLTPTPDGDRETGYTVVAKGEYVDAFESYRHGHKRYGVEPSRMRWSILRHTIAIDTLTELAEQLLAQSGSFGECTAITNENGTTGISIHLTEDDIPSFFDPLLNSVLQYGIYRYAGYDYATDSLGMVASYDCYNTPSEGLMICLRFVRLHELTIDAVLDDYDRIQSVSGALVLDYEDKMRMDDTQLRLVFEQNAFDYGISHVEDDPWSYHHWGAADESDR